MQLTYIFLTSMGNIVLLFMKQKKFRVQASSCCEKINESIHWIELLPAIEAVDDKTYASISSDAVDIREISIAIIKTSAKSIKN